VPADRPADAGRFSPRDTARSLPRRSGARDPPSPERPNEEPPPDGMLDADPPDDEEDPAEEPPDEPPEPPPDGRETAVPLLLPLAGRDSGRSFACFAQAGLTLSASVATAAQKRRVIGVLLTPLIVNDEARFRQN
jgi:hypothetical protein